MRAYCVVLGTLLILGFPARASAQPLVRADVTGLVAWLNANKSGISEYNGWYNRSAYGGASAGWYWTDHLKTEVDVGASSPADLYASEPVDVNGVRTYTYSEYRFSTRRIAVSQRYQFMRNAWVHPHVGAGLDATWERIRETSQPVFSFDQVTRTTRLIQPASTEEETRLRYRPFAEIGLKAYMSRTVFFRSDMRMVFHGGLDEVLLRFGVGVDLGAHPSWNRQ